MPKLIPEGPEIPEVLLNELEDGKVVFFCGAGISMGPESKLPSFKKLVCQIYRSNNLIPSEVEKNKLKNNSWDKALDLLENRLGKKQLRETVIKLLSKPPQGKLSLHKALIELSKNETGLRLVTTNFDNRFVEAGVDKNMVDVAPKLPIPKFYDWSSLVHLHGSISLGGEDSSLVLTSADFGLGYSTERWAVRFVTELFRTFTVVFVGYDLNDLPLQYIIDALAKKRESEEQVKKVYAFADYDGLDDSMSIVSKKWESKNVIPIVYNKKENYRLLRDTIIEWAHLKRNPNKYRSEIAINEMKHAMSNLEGYASKRVLWALQDPVAAKTLADKPAEFDENEFVKIERWLNIFSKGNLLHNNASGISQIASDQTQTKNLIIDYGPWMIDPKTIDQIQRHLAVWMAKHLHVPQLLTWVLNNESRLHPSFRQEVQWRLSENKPKLTDRLQLLWTIFIYTSFDDQLANSWTCHHYESASKDERQRIEEKVIALIKPRLAVFPGAVIGKYLFPQGKKNPATNQLIDDCAHIQLISCPKEIFYKYSKILENSSFLYRFAETLTEYLELALQLIEKDDFGYSKSPFLWRSIAEHEQNWDGAPCTKLIDLVRDSYFEIIHEGRLRADRPRTDNLLNRWVASKHTLFKRLALHALAENTKSDISLVKNLLLKNQAKGLWCLEMRREVLRFFRKAGNRMPRNLRFEIEGAILAGPKLKKVKDPFYNPERICCEKALRLYKLQVSGVKLNKKKKVLADKAAPCRDNVGNDQDEFLTLPAKARTESYKEIALKNLVNGSVNDIRVAMEENEINDYEFRILLGLRSAKVVSALRYLSKDGKWLNVYWEKLLWYLGTASNQNNNVKMNKHVASIIAPAPDKFFSEFSLAASTFVLRIAHECITNEETTFKILWTRAWTMKQDIQPNNKSQDPITSALLHPEGKLAEAALIRLEKQKSVADKGIPSEVKSYFDAIVSETDGHQGRIMLMTQLHHLFTIDLDWTQEHLIEPLHKVQSNKSTDLWSAFGWSPRLDRGLFQSLKSPLLKIITKPDHEFEFIQRLRRLLISVYIDLPNELSKQDILDVVRVISNEGLTSLLDGLTRRFSENSKDSKLVWQEEVYPWLLEFWPKASSRNTIETSEAILSMLVECDDAFPEAAMWSLDYLRSYKGDALQELTEKDYAKSYPDEMLQILNKIIEDKTLDSLNRVNLKNLLDEMRESNNEVSNDPKFQRLYKIAFA